MTKDGKKDFLTYVRLSAFVLASLWSSPLRAQNITCAQPIVFGTFSVSCPVAATATINPDGTRSTTGCLIAGPGPFSNGSCNVSQNFPFQSIKITAPAADQLTRTAGPQTMALNNFNLMTNANGRTFTTSGPFANVPIGCRVNTGAAPTSGTYQGTVTITAVFQ